MEKSGQTLQHRDTPRSTLAFLLAGALSTVAYTARLRLASQACLSPRLQVVTAVNSKGQYCPVGRKARQWETRNLNTVSSFCDVLRQPTTVCASSPQLPSLPCP